VARLKWGDPFVFDSGGKEALFLHEQGVPFDIVPGIPAAVGATAYAGVPLTYPGGGDSLVLLRGDEDEAGRLPDVDWTALGQWDGTIACVAGPRLVRGIVQALLDHGAAPETPAAIIHRGTLPGQRTIAATLEQLAGGPPGIDDGSSGLLVIGEVTGLREHLRWFDERPLFGCRIVVTRSPEQARELIERLEHFGAEAVQAPTFRLRPPEDPEAVDRAAASADEFDWIVFESAGAVTRFLAALTHGPRDLRALGRVRLTAIGPSAADRLAAAGLKPDVVAAEFGERVADAMAARHTVGGARVLVVRPDHWRDVVSSDLERRGARVTDLIAYRTEAIQTDSPAAQALYRALLEGTIHAVTFTSPTAVRRFAALIGEEQAADLLNTTTVATIGPVTAAAAEELGVARPLVPAVYTVDGMIDLLVETLGGRHRLP
jgi:uroporphyrinogen III methyltransferase/synthase